jgi:murein DD-endopeptidase MepM/ murein hydrolase activator NlpD
MRKVSKRKLFFWIVVVIILVGFLIPDDFIMPVQGANQSSYNAQSYWYYPWGSSGTHKGVDVFAKEGTMLKSSTRGIVIYTGSLKKGGNVILILGPRWKLHYYAHLNKISTHVGALTGAGEKIGTVGASGNAKGKSPHLHYAIITLIPRPWRIDDAPQGWKKMFYLNPIDFLRKASGH